MKIDDIFSIVSRAAFLPEAVRSKAAVDAPLQIGYGQTNSQPTTVKRMLTWLDPQAGEKILDVGSGSGWTTALLAYLVGNKGQVYAVERVPELVAFGKDNCRKFGITNAQFFRATNSIGLPQFAPYDRILVSAAADKLPKALVRQLAPNGRMVVPIQSSIWVLDKDKNENLSIDQYDGYSFVRLIND